MSTIKKIRGYLESTEQKEEASTVKEVKQFLS